jgi:hypothetical protein
LNIFILNRKLTLQEEKYRIQVTTIIGLEELAYIDSCGNWDDDKAQNTSEKWLKFSRIALTIGS